MNSFPRGPFLNFPSSILRFKRQQETSQATSGEEVRVCSCRLCLFRSLQVGFGVVSGRGLGLGAGGEAPRLDTLVLFRRASECEAYT